MCAKSFFETNISEEQCGLIISHVIWSIFWFCFRLECICIVWSSMTSNGSGYTLRSRKSKMVPYVTSSTKPLLTQDSPKSLSQDHDTEIDGIMDDTNIGHFNQVTVLDESLVNGAATCIQLKDPGGADNIQEGRV